MTDNVIGCFAVTFGFCCSPGPLQFLLRIVGWLPEGEKEPVSRIKPAQIAEISRRIILLLDDR